MVMELTVTLLKLISTSLAGAFGLLGLLTDYRDEKTKQITRFGKIALAGILVSTIVALSTQGLEYWLGQEKATKAAIEARDAALRAETTLYNINRLLQPIGDIEVAFNFKIQSDHPDIAGYLETLRAELKKAGRRFISTGEGSRQKGIKIVATDKRRGIHSFSVLPKSPLLPNRDEPASLLKFIVFQIDWYAGPWNPEIATEDNGKPDLRLLVDESDFGKDAKLHTRYDPKTDEFSLSGIFSEASVQEDNGSLSSTLDIPGSTIVVRTPKSLPLELESLSIKVAEGKIYRVNRFIPFKADDRDANLYRFPKDAKPQVASLGLL